MEVDCLFQIGEKIVYPMHGAGFIETIEEKDILGEIRQYYVIKLSISNLQISIPVGNEVKLGIRPVIDTLALKNVKDIFQNGETDVVLSSKERVKINSEKIKTGKIEASEEDVRDLLRLNEEKALNSSEKNMLNKAKEILFSELELVNGITENEIQSFSSIG
mgnify:FL=1